MDFSGFLISLVITTLLILYINKRLASQQNLPGPWGYSLATLLLATFTLKVHLWATAGANNPALGHLRLVYLPGFLLEYLLLLPATITTAVVTCLVWMHNLGRAGQGSDSGFEQRMEAHFSDKQ